MPITTHKTSFINVAHTELWIFDFLLANQNRYTNEVLSIRIWWRQTTWVVLVPITTHITSFINVAHTELWIFDFFISQSEQICKWGIKYAHLVTTDHMGSTCAHHYPHTKFHQCSPYRTLDIWLFVISQSEHICKWGIKYVHLVTTDHVGSTCAPPPTTHIPSLMKIGHCVLIREWRFTFDVDEKPTSVHTSIHPSVHPYRQRYKWKLSGPSSIAGGPQKEQTHKIILVPNLTQFVINWYNNTS